MSGDFASVQPVPTPPADPGIGTPASMSPKEVPQPPASTTPAISPAGTSTDERSAVKAQLKSLSEQFTKLLADRSVGQLQNQVAAMKRQQGNPAAVNMLQRAWPNCFIGQTIGTDGAGNYAWQTMSNALAAAPGPSPDGLTAALGTPWAAREFNGRTDIADGTNVLLFADHDGTTQHYSIAPVATASAISTAWTLTVYPCVDCEPGTPTSATIYALEIDSACDTAAVKWHFDGHHLSADVWTLTVGGPNTSPGSPGTIGPTYNPVIQLNFPSTDSTHNITLSVVDSEGDCAGRTQTIQANDPRKLVTSVLLSATNKTSAIAITQQVAFTTGAPISTTVNVPLPTLNIVCSGTGIYANMHY